MKSSKTNFWQYQFMVLSRAAQKAWNKFGALGTVLGLVAAIIAGVILGDGETLKSALLTALISLGMLLIIIGVFFVLEPAIIYNEQQSQINNFSTESINDNSIDASHLATSSSNSIELRYVLGNEPIKILSVELFYLDKQGQRFQNPIGQFYSLSDDSLKNQVNLSVLSVGEGVRFSCPSKDETNEVVVKIQLRGVKTKKDLDIEKTIRLKPNQVWFMT